MSYNIEDDQDINRIDSQLPINEGVLTPEEEKELAEINAMVKAGKIVF